MSDPIFTDYKTSQEWCEIITDIIVIDPDGWDRTNYQHSWYEEQIDMKTYLGRVAYSTCAYPSGFDCVREKWLHKLYGGEDA